MPQFLNRMQALCMQADYLMNRSEYERYSRGGMRASIYGFGFPQVGTYSGMYGGSYDNMIASVNGGYGNNSPYLQNMPYTMQDHRANIDAMFENAKNQSLQTQTQQSSSRQQNPQGSNPIGENLYNQKDARLVADSTWSDLITKQNNGETLDAQQTQTLQNLYKSGLTQNAQYLVQYIDYKNQDTDGKVSKEEFVKYYQDQLSGTKTDAELKTDAEQLFSILNQNSSDGEYLDINEVATMLAMLDSDSEGEIDGTIKAEDFKTNLSEMLSRGATAVSNLYNQFFGS